MPLQTHTADPDLSSLSGKRIRVTYRPVNRDLPNRSTHFGEPTTLEIDIEHVDGVIVDGVDEHGRRISLPIAGGLKSIRARPADRDQGAYTIHVGNRKAVRVLNQ